MSRLAIFCLPVMLLIGPCSEGRGNETNQAEGEAVPANDGTMAAPDAMINTDGTNSSNANGATNQGMTNGTMALSGLDQSAATGSDMNPSWIETTTGSQTGDTTTQGKHIAHRRVTSSGNPCFSIWINDFHLLQPSHEQLRSALACSSLHPAACRSASLSSLAML